MTQLMQTVSASKLIGITPSDSVEISDANGTVKTRAIYVGGDGDIVVENHEGDPITISGLVAGVLLPISVTKVRATGTTATNIVGLY